MLNGERPRTSAIDGATRLLVIVGDPISQVKSPLFYNARLAAAGQNAVLIPWHAPEPQFHTVMRGLLDTANIDGIVVTFPFKQRALAYASRLEPMAERVGAVNALRRETDGSWTGGMFDGLGLIRALAAVGRSPWGSKVKLIGAGGAGSAIAHAVADAGAASLSIYDTATEKLAQLVANISRIYPHCRVAVGGPDLGQADVLINATPVGLAEDDGLPMSLPDLNAKIAVVDIVPRASTALLRYAADRGCSHIGGSAMVEGQADLVLSFFNKRSESDAPQAPSELRCASGGAS